MQFISIFIDIRKFADSSEKLLMSAETGGVSRDSCIFGSSLGKV